MRIVDYKIMRPPLDEFNFVLVADEEGVRAELKGMECSDAEISSMKGEKDTLLNVLPVLAKKRVHILSGKRILSNKEKKGIKGCRKQKYSENSWVLCFVRECWSDWQGVCR